MRKLKVVVGLGSVLVIAVSVWAYCEIQFLWTPQGQSTEWDNEANWGANGTFPGETACNGSAVIGAGAPVWPRMQNDRFVCDLTMSACASLDLAARALVVAGEFKIECGPDGTPTQAEVVDYDGIGVVRAKRIVIAGGACGAELAVANCTVQTEAGAACP